MGSVNLDAVCSHRPGLDDPARASGLAGLPGARCHGHGKGPGPGGAGIWKETRDNGLDLRQLGYGSESDQIRPDSEARHEDPEPGKL